MKVLFASSSIVLRRMGAVTVAVRAGRPGSIDGANSDLWRAIPRLLAAGPDADESAARAALWLKCTNREEIAPILNRGMVIQATGIEKKHSVV